MLLKMYGDLKSLKTPDGGNEMLGRLDQWREFLGLSLELFRKRPCFFIGSGRFGDINKPRLILERCSCIIYFRTQFNG